MVWQMNFQDDDALQDAWDEEDATQPPNLLTIDLDPETLGDDAAARVLPCLETSAPFRAWLQPLVSTGIVWRRFSSSSCPLASFLQCEGYLQPLVDDGFVTTDPEEYAKVHPMPVWASVFVRAVDAGGTDTRDVTAQEALALLDAEAPHGD